MEFDRENDLQDFLISYLESQGIRCTKEYRLPSGDRLDILAGSYAIECKNRLNRKDLDSAVGQLGRYMPYLSGLQPVVAGLAVDSARTAAISHRQNGTEVWFIDEMQEIREYYDELYGYYPESEYYDPESEYEDEFDQEDLQNLFYPSGSYSRNSEDFGWLVPVGVGIGVFVMIGLAVNSYNSPIHELHRAAIRWDINTANKAISKLQASEDECDILLGNTVQWEFRRAINRGARGNEFYSQTFNRMNVIQDWLMNQYPQCVYPRLNHPNQLAK